MLPEHPKNFKRKFTTHCNGAWVRKGLGGDGIYLADTAAQDRLMVRLKIECDAAQSDAANEVLHRG